MKIKHHYNAKTLLTILLIIVLCVESFYIQQFMSGSESRIQSNSTLIDRLEGDEYQAQSVKTLTVAQGKHVVFSALKAGQAVADIQNGYANVKPDMTHVQTIKLDRYFADDDYTAKSMWYAVNAVQGAHWQFNTPYTFSQTYVNVVWQCKLDGKLLAYVTGTYNAISQKFTDMQLQETTDGNNAYKQYLDKATQQQYDIPQHAKRG